MDYKNNSNMQRAIIIDNYENPDKKTKDDFANEEYKSYNFSSESCIDNLTLFLKIENNEIVDCLFNGVGCAVSSAASNIMCNLLINKTKEQALSIIYNYEKMLANEKYDEEMIEELNVFSNIHNQPNRIKCAKISSESIKRILKG
ncbi:MAG: iron-sulfur cluster assembly scaffold protein [Mycoplasmoidaceae bacterium]